MDSVVLNRPIQITVIMTPAFRERFIKEARAQIARIEENMARLETSGPPPSSDPSESDARQAELIRHQIDAECARLRRRCGEIEWRIKEIEAVEDGAEIPYRSYEGTVELRLGDHFLEKMAEAEVILKDWLVVGLRRAGMAPS